MKSLKFSKEFQKQIQTNVLRAFVAFVFICFLLLCFKENPIHVFKIFLNASCGSFENFSYTLFYAVPLIFTGTSVALAFQCGLFNIGAEGQLYIGALLATVWGIKTAQWSSTFFIPGIVFGVLFAFLGGALWAGIAGALKVWFKIHEVISTIMLNFIAAALVNWMVLYPLKNPDTQSIETKWIGETFRIPPLWHHMTSDFFLAIITAILFLVFIHKTYGGFRIRAVGENSKAARVAGMHIPMTRLKTMCLAGGVAGLAGFHEIYFSSYRLIDGFSPGFGFTAIGIAMISGSRPFVLIVTSIFFAALHKGSLDLDIETETITRDLSAIIQAIILLVLAAKSARRKEQ